MSKRRREYYQYLDSREWRDLRRKTFERDGFRCVKCGSDRNLRGHHVRYRGNIHSCTVDDLQTLCKACHEALHRRKARERKRDRKPRQMVRHLIWILCQYDAEA